MSNMAANPFVYIIYCRLTFSPAIGPVPVEVRARTRYVRCRGAVLPPQTVLKIVKVPNEVHCHIIFRDHNFHMVCLFVVTMFLSMVI